MSMIDVSNLTFGYEGSPELVFDHVSFQIDTDWKLGFTGRNGRKGAKRSTGLGLYLCRKLCRKLGLEITAASTPGAGTEITLWIPRGEFSRVAHPQGLEDRL